LSARGGTPSGFSGFSMRDGVVPATTRAARLAGLGDISSDEGMVIQIATIVTFILSTYWVVLTYPTPISHPPFRRH